MRPLSSQVVAIVLGAACTACRVEPSHPKRSEALDASPAPVLVHSDHTDLRYGGWVDRHDPSAVRLAWPGTHIEASFRGTSISARITDTPIEDETRETDWLAVAIDDAPPVAVPLREGLQLYPLAEGLSAGTHRVLIWKRTEAEVGVVTFHGLELGPGGEMVAALPQPKRRIVFIGDSVTAGYGNEGRDAKCHWTAETENNYASYGAVAARDLQAEYVAAAWSGKGIMRNYDARDTALMSELRKHTVPTEDSSPTVSPWPADVVVVNLGTNDFFQGVPPRKAFLTAYRELLEALRAEHPDALFVLQVGPMLADDYPQPRALSRMRYWVKLVRAQRRSDRDKRSELIEFWVDPKEGLGCDSHPSVATHARLGRELAAMIRKQLKW